MVERPLVKRRRARHKRKKPEVALVTNQVGDTRVSEIGLEIQGSSLREFASRAGLAEDDYLRTLAFGYKKRIAATLECLSLLEIPPTNRDSFDQIMLSQQAAFDRLEDPYYVLEYRQAQLEELYGLLVAMFEKWLQLSLDAQAMLNSAHLSSVERQLDLPSTGSLTDRCVRLARAVHIVSPLDTRFNAHVIKLVPVVKLFSGLLDCFYGASALIVIASADEVDDHVEVRNLRSFPEEFECAVGILREIVEMAVGMRLQAPEAQVPSTKPALKALEHALYYGAVGFVVFHELAHLLLPVVDNEFEEEHQCDAFASHILSASGDPALICGLYVGQMLSDAIHAEAEGWQSVLKHPQSHQSLRTHPRTPSRIHRVATFIEQHGMMPVGPFDALLSIPTRLMEEEIFEHSTRWDIFSRLEQYFSSHHEGELSEEIRNSIPARLVWAVRLPRLSESTEVTLQPEGDLRARIVTYDLPGAISAAAEMINARLIEDPVISKEEKDVAIAQTQKQAVALALECLAVLAKKPIPPFDAAEVLHSLITAENHERKLDDLIGELDSQMTANNGLRALEGLGCILINDGSVQVLNNVKIRLVHKPRYD
jgi:hypothetical protein